MYSMAFRLKWKVIFFFMTKHIVGWLIPEIPKSIVKKCNMVLSFDSVTRIRIKSLRVTIHWMKATEQYLSVVLFIMLYKVVLIFESVDKILWCDHSSESYWAVLSCGTVYYVVTFKSVDEILLLCPYITLLVSVVGVFNLCFKLDVTSESNNPVLAGRDSNGTFPCVRKKKGKSKERKNINDLGNTVYQRPFI